VVRRRLVVENDDKSYSLKDCYTIHQATGIPILFDVFHHQVLSSGEDLSGAFAKISPTWRKKDGLPMVDYSVQRKEERKGAHAESIDVRDFKKFLERTKGFDFDLMLEIKDKEKSALRAVKIAAKDRRFWSSS
jgi:UV DNA damage endonuclease